MDWLDLPAKFVQQAHAYWRYTGDQGFAADVYPAATKAMDHLLGLDFDGDGIPDATGFCTTYDDIVMEGAAIYVAAFTVGACEAMADFATALDTSDVAARRRPPPPAPGRPPKTRCGCRARATTGSIRPALRAPRCSPMRCAASATAARDGLPDVLDRSRHGLAPGPGVPPQRRRLRRRAVRAVNTVDPAGGPAPGRQARAVWPGGSFFIAAVMHAVGLGRGRDDLVAAGLTTGFGVYRTTYADDRTAFWFDTPARWDPGFPFHYGDTQYQRARGAWELLVAVKDPFPSGWAP